MYYQVLNSSSDVPGLWYNGDSYSALQVYV